MHKYDFQSQYQRQQYHRLAMTWYPVYHQDFSWANKLRVFSNHLKRRFHGRPSNTDLPGQLLYRLCTRRSTNRHANQDGPFGAVGLRPHDHRRCSYQPANIPAKYVCLCLSPYFSKYSLEDQDYSQAARYS